MIKESGGREQDNDYFCRIPVTEKTWLPDRDSNWDLHGKRLPCFGRILPRGIDLSDPGNSSEGLQKTFYGRFGKSFTPSPPKA